jgi:hypothetical protein
MNPFKAEDEDDCTTLPMPLRNSFIECHWVVVSMNLELVLGFSSPSTARSLHFMGSLLFSDSLRTVERFISCCMPFYDVRTIVVSTYKEKKCCFTHRSPLRNEFDLFNNILPAALPFGSHLLRKQRREE